MDLSINIAETLEKQDLSPDEGKQMLSSVKRAMDSGNVAIAKQHMVEFALK
jgi:hypothetical protein